MRVLLLSLMATTGLLCSLAANMIFAARDLADQARGARAAKNHEVCYQIAGSWWGNRLAEKTRAQITAADAVCDVWSGRPAFCNSVAARATTSGYTTEQLTMPCTTVGAHDKRCIANPCNSYNTGSCTLQATAGQCVWFDGEALAKYNSHLSSIGQQPLKSHGCFRNPCSAPLTGMGRQIAACPGYSVPGLIQCIWCVGGGDAVLEGLGVGCQMTTPTTDAACAPVNSQGVPKQSVMMSTANNRCQCDSRYPFCAAQVAQERGAWKHRY